MRKFISACFLLIGFLSTKGYSQKMYNEKDNEILIWDSEDGKGYEIAFEPTSSEMEDCDCGGGTVTVYKTKVKGIYESKDKKVKLQEIEKKYKIDVFDKSRCCFVKPGLYKY